MPYLIGTDEAGYGPNLGPLVIGATLWEVPVVSDCLYDTLRAVVCRDPRQREREQLAIGDSKSIYQSGGTLEELERSVLATLQCCGRDVASFTDLIEVLSLDDSEAVFEQTGYDWEDLQVPRHHCREVISGLAGILQSSCHDRGIQLQSVDCQFEFPSSFNSGIRRFGNKAGLLSAQTCRLVKRLLTFCTGEVLVLCDKHGGRAHYAGIIQHEITDAPVKVEYESREVSIYRWSEGERQVEIRFIARGEQNLPVALSSMTAKYCRELCMQAWNHFWIQHLPKLKPTAGYPMDARRFRAEIAETQLALGIGDDCIWRSR